jgi:hypothetical protein
MAPESSDGLASVGTILPKERAALCQAAFSVLKQGILLGEDGRFFERSK